MLITSRSQMKIYGGRGTISSIYFTGSNFYSFLLLVHCSRIWFSTYTSILKLVKYECKLILKNYVLINTRYGSLLIIILFLCSSPCVREELDPNKIFGKKNDHAKPFACHLWRACIYNVKYLLITWKNYGCFKFKYRRVLKSDSTCFLWHLRACIQFKVRV